MQYIDKMLGDNKFVAGENFSMADITLFMGLGLADFAKIEIPEQYKNLSKWRNTVATRPSVVALGGLAK